MIADEVTGWRASLLAASAGAATMAAELSAVRLAAPFLGGSLPVWGSVIALTLASLAAGAALGGRWSRRPLPGRRAAWLCLAAGVWLAWLPVPGRWWLACLVAPSSVGWARLASGAGLLLLGAAPLLAAGACPPLLIRAATQVADDAGAAAGRLAAWGTAGSLVGTLGPALIVLPLLGTRLTFGLAGGVLAFGALVAGRRPGLALLALVALLAVGGWPADADGRPGERTLFRVESPYASLRVVEDDRGTRRIRTGGGWTEQAIRLRSGEPSHGSWPLLARTPALAGLTRSSRGRALVIGAGGGTLLVMLRRRFPGLALVGVELDPMMTSAGRRFLGADEAGARWVTADGRRALSRLSGRFEAIVVDAFDGPYVPFQLLTREAFAAARERLAPGGVLALNLLRWRTDRRLEAAVWASARASFTHAAAADAANPINSVLYLSDRPLSGVGLRPPAPGGAALTDDRAPVEWLVHGLGWAMLRDGR